VGGMGLVVMIGVVAGIVAYAVNQKPPTTVAVAPRGEGFGGAEAWSDEDCPIPVSHKDPTWGSRTAPATIVVFSDFECPFCQRLEPTLNAMRDRYGSQELRIVWKNNPLPFHKNAQPAAAAAMAVFELRGSQGFWTFHDAAFANQRDLRPDQYEAWARLAGADMSRFPAASALAGAKVEADVAVGKAAGVLGTPASFVNGILLSGAQPAEKFQSTIDAEIAAAKAEIAAGTRPDRVYVERTKKNKSSAPAPIGTQDPPVDDKAVWKVPVGDSPVRGPATALVTIVMFSDFQCPFCARVEPTLTQVRQTYGDKVRIVWKNQPLPFHPRAEPAAELALEAAKQKGPERFWDAHDLLMQNQQRLDDESLDGYARTLGLDVARTRRAILERTYAAAITADQELADDMGATGTPTFFINGRKLQGAQPFERFQAMIDEEIPKSERLLREGVPAKGVYDAIIKDGKGPPPPEKKTVAPPSATNPFRGGAGAPVVIQMFSDFQCPFCKRVEPTIAELLAAHGNEIKVVWRHKPLPMHPDAALAAEAAQEAFRQGGNSAFWKFHDTLFDNQTEGLGRAALERYAEAQGLEMAAFRKALDERTHRAVVEADALASDRAGISGTPSFVINGYFLSGAQPKAKFEKLIRQALAESRAR
jgi:protein-disulfide isomerase